MGDIKADRPSKLSEVAEANEVIDQSVIAKERAAFREHESAGAGLHRLVGGVGHFSWGQELALFDVDGFASLATRGQQIGLATEKGRDLQEINDLSNRVCLCWLMHIGRDWNVVAVADRGQLIESLADSWATGAGQTGAIGLVEASFEDPGDIELAAHLLDSIADRMLDGIVLKDAGASDDGELMFGADGDRPDCAVM